VCPRNFSWDIKSSAPPGLGGPAGPISHFAPPFCYIPPRGFSAPISSFGGLPPGPRRVFFPPPRLGPPPPLICPRVPAVCFNPGALFTGPGFPPPLYTPIGQFQMVPPNRAQRLFNPGPPWSVKAKGNKAQSVGPVFFPKWVSLNRVNFRSVCSGFFRGTKPWAWAILNSRHHRACAHSGRTTSNTANSKRPLIGISPMN